MQQTDLISDTQVEKELKAYLGEKNANCLDAIKWWRANCVAYPVLSIIARRNMCVRATSAEAERDFSAAGLVSGKLR